MLSWPIVVLVCGGSAVLTEAQLAKAQALQQYCELGVCVCAALSEQEKKATRAKMKPAKTLKRSIPYCRCCCCSRVSYFDTPSARQQQAAGSSIHVEAGRTSRP